MFRLCKPLKAIYISHKIKLTHLTANKSEKETIFLVEVVMKKYGCQYCNAKEVLLKVQYFRRLMIDFELHFI